MTTNLNSILLPCHQAKSVLLKWISYSAVFVALMMFSGYSAAFDVLGPVEIKKPMDGPGFRAVGWKWHYIDQNGMAGHMEKVASNSDKNGNELASYERTDGCHWTRLVRGFAPAVKWTNCPSTGKATVNFESGTIWPLQLGNSFVYKVGGASNLLARAWKTKRQCTVTATERIRIVSGEYDAYKLVCEERFGTRTWWLSPEVGTAVVYEHKPKRGDYIRQEYVRIEQGPDD